MAQARSRLEVGAAACSGVALLTGREAVDAEVASAGAVSGRGSGAAGTCGDGGTVQVVST